MFRKKYRSLCLNKMFRMEWAWKYEFIIFLLVNISIFKWTEVLKKESIFAVNSILQRVVAFRGVHFHHIQIYKY